MFTDPSGRNYRIVLGPISEDDGGGWIARVPELPGCMAAADTIEEALEMLQEAKEAWICAAESTGQSVPEASPTDHEYSGKFTLRIPRSLHRQLAMQAEAEGTSLNQYCIHLLSGRVVQASLPSNVTEALETTIRQAYYDAVSIYDEPTWLEREQGGDYGKIAVVASSN